MRLAAARPALSQHRMSPMRSWRLHLAPAVSIQRPRPPRLRLRPLLLHRHHLPLSHRPSHPSSHRYGHPPLHPYLRLLNQPLYPRQGRPSRPQQNLHQLHHRHHPTVHQRHQRRLHQLHHLQIPVLHMVALLTVKGLLKRTEVLCCADGIVKADCVKLALLPPQKKQSDFLRQRQVTVVNTRVHLRCRQLCNQHTHPV